MGREKSKKPWCQVFTCHRCGEVQFIFGLQDLRDLGVKVRVIEEALEEAEVPDKEKLN